MISATIFDIAHEFVIFRKEQQIQEATITIIETEAEHYSSLIINEREQLLNISMKESAKESFCVKISQCFSIYKNFKKIFHVSNDENQLSCLHGIRVLSLAWVILGHSYVFVVSLTG